MRGAFQLIAVLAVASIGLVVSAQPADADPSFGSDAAFPILGTAPNTILEPAAGAPVAGPLLPPPATVYGSLLTPPLAPGAGEVDDFSFGNDVFLGPPPGFLEFSVGFGSVGHPGAMPPPVPRADVRAEAGVVGLPPFGDGAVASDIYQTGPGPIPGPLMCAPIGLFYNAQILDDDGALAVPFAPRLGLNAQPMGPPPSNVDAYDHSDDTVVNPVPGVPLEMPVFFTIDAATAAGWAGGPLPAPGGGVAIPGAADILAFHPLTGGPVIWATAAALGLIPGDDIDALAVSFTSGVPVLPPFGPGFDVAPGADLIMFSLAPGSPSLSPTSGGLAATPLAGCAPAPVPGAGTAADLWVVGVPFTFVPAGIGGAFLYLNAESIGLNTIRSGGGFEDNIDAIDWCNTLTGLDIDVDLVDDGCDFDIDGDGIGNTIDPDDDGDGFGDPQQTLHIGPANTAVGLDNCPLVPNPTQANSDGNFVDTSPPYAVGTDDKTWVMSDAQGDACDSDDDNDGLTDADEASGASCAGFITAPLLSDSDADRYLDGAECALGSNPLLAGSFPAFAACGLAGDADLDKVTNRVEFCFYNSSAASTDSDGDIALDGAKDGCEVASINGDRVVNSGDQGKLASGISGSVPYHAGTDVNKDGILNSGDQGLMTSFIVPGGQCP